MAGIVESYKKVFENRKRQIEVFVLVLIWSVLSNLFDIAMNKPNTFRQNPFDFIFNFIIGMYSIQFLHNVLCADGKFPTFKEINWKAIGGLFTLNITWGLYLTGAIIVALISYLICHCWALPIIVLTIILTVSLFVFYIFIAYSTNFEFKGLMDIRLLFKFLKVSFKQTYLKFILFTLITLAIIIVCLLLYIVATSIGLDKVCLLANDYSLFDTLMFTGMVYFVIVSWNFAFPYSLINIYNEKISPLLNNNIENINQVDKNNSV